MFNIMYFLYFKTFNNVTRQNVSDLHMKTYHWTPYNNSQLQNAHLLTYSFTEYAKVEKKKTVLLVRLREHLRNANSPGLGLGLGLGGLRSRLGLGEIDRTDVVFSKIKGRDAL